MRACFVFLAVRVAVARALNSEWTLAVVLDNAGERSEPPLPHPAHYADWFSYFDNIDLRRHLRDIEVVLIEAALEKSDGMVSQAAEALKLRRTTLIEKMKKLMIERPPSAKEG